MLTYTDWPRSCAVICRHLKPTATRLSPINYRAVVYLCVSIFCLLSVIIASEYFIPQSNTTPSQFKLRHFGGESFQEHLYSYIRRNIFRKFITVVLRPRCEATRRLRNERFSFPGSSVFAHNSISSTVIFLPLE